MRYGCRKDYLKGSRRNGRGHSPYPFERLLASRVGRLWDDVYSELCEEFDSRSYPGYRFHHNIDWKVYRHCWIGAETGTVYSDHRGWPGEVRNEYYVHPHTGILCYAFWTPPEKASRPVTEVPTDADNRLEQIEGIWFRFHVDHFPYKYVYMNGQGEMVEKDCVRDHTTKTQMNKKELRAQGLSNGQPIAFGERCVICGFDGKCVHWSRAAKLHFNPGH